MPTQQEFAAHVGITRQAVGQMAQKGILPQGGTLDEWRLAYCANLREVDAGRQSETGGFDLTDERARLAKLQADKVEIELAELRGEVVRADDVSR
jgi:terminase small subunit / prophage DNA-packing protein